MTTEKYTQMTKTVSNSGKSRTFSNPEFSTHTVGDRCFAGLSDRGRANGSEYEVGGEVGGWGWDVAQIRRLCCGFGGAEG
ncbi:MAG: hypothetical protein J1E38_07965 [Paramuribaculum sp.]|nr:hypothetical protein [Paramuribaculum sp.]